MFQKVLEYAGAYRRTTYLTMVVMLIGIVMKLAPLGLGCYFAILIGQYGQAAAYMRLNLPAGTLPR